VGLFVDIPKPTAWPPPSLDDSEEVQKLIAYGYERDPIGDKVHTAFACLFLFSIPQGSGVASVTLALLAGYSVLRIASTWRTLTPLYNSIIYRLLLAWIFWSLLSLLWSPEPGTGLDVAGTFRMVFLPLVLWPIMRQWKYLLLAFLGGVFVQNMFQLSELIVSWFSGGEDWIWKGPLKSLRGTDIHTGKTALFMAYAALVWVGVILTTTRHKKLAVAGLLFPIAGMLSTVSRAVFVGSSISTLFLFVFIISHKKIKVKRAILTALGILLVSLVTFSFVKERVITKTSRAVQGVQEFLDGDLNTYNSSQRRLYWWVKTTKAATNDSGFLFFIGHGLGSVAAIDFSKEGTELNKTEVHVHNTYIQVLYEQGLVGLILFIAFLISMIKEARRINFNVGWSVGPLCIAGVLLWATVTFFENSQSSGRPFAMLILLSIFIMYITTMNSRKTGTRKSAPSIL
jgi:O-antigen ligase